MTKPVCLVTGVGDSTGASIVRRFVEGGYRIAMIARNAERLEKLANEIDDATAYPCDVGDLDMLNATIEKIRQEMGPPTVLIHNVVSFTFDTFLEADPKELEKNFRVNTTSQG